MAAAAATVLTSAPFLRRSIPGVGRFTSLLLPIHANDNGKSASPIRATERRQLLCYCTETEVQNSVTESTTLDEKDSAVKEAANTLDIRVGRILKAWRHEEADSLYVEEVDVGEPEPRIICSGLVKYIPLHLLQDRNVIVLANLKPRNMRGVKSNGMLMAASDASHENVELLVPPEGAVAGDRVWFGSDDEKESLPDVASPNQVQKKKIWELVQPHLKTDDACAATLGTNHQMRTSAGPIISQSLKNASTFSMPILYRPLFLSQSSDNHRRWRLRCKVDDPPIITSKIPEDPIFPDDDDDEESPLLQLGNSAILSACFVGLFTGITVILFNYTVHEIQEVCWGEIPERGASWLREQPIETKWERVIIVPAFGGLIVSLLNMARTALEDSTDGSAIKSALKPILKTVAACVTLGTGNSLGPEGPSVEIGVSVAKGVGSFLDKSGQRKLSLRAAGSAAGISSGFNAAVGGCFFAVESVLWPSPAESSLSLTNTTSMVILSAVIASVISEIGLGSQPAFAVPLYDFRSPSELPLYLLLGAVCGLVSVGLTQTTSFMLTFFDGVERSAGIPKAVFPILGGVTVGCIALVYPEILYWGFQNVDTLLESRPFAKSLSADLLVQLVAVKIVATSLCRASGLVGGYYAPSLFIGAATGMAYGKIVGHLISVSNPMLHLSILEVASPRAYALVGMAATLAGVCQVPLTAVLLLFELTQDYRIVLPLLGAVGFSAWITSDKTRKRGTADNAKQQNDGNASTASSENNICELESSLCLNSESDDENIRDEIPVSQAMRRRYVKTELSSRVTDVVSLMLEEKQSCALIVDDSDCLIGQLTLTDIQNFIELSIGRNRKPEVARVSEVCSSYGGRCQVLCTAFPNMSLLTALSLMNRHGISQLPVVDGDGRGCPVGLLDTESINLAFRAFAIQDGLSSSFFMEEDTFKN